MESAKNYVKMKCMHFLKIASLLQYYLYDKEVSFSDLVRFKTLRIKIVFFICFIFKQNSFEYLIQNLTVSFQDETNEELKPILKWASSDPSAILNSWFKDLNEASESYQLQTDVITFSIL